MSALVIRYGKAPPIPLHVLLSVIPSLPRPALDRLVERAINRMDEDDGDPDVEANGDDLDSSNAEDEIAASYCRSSSPGCPIADPA